MIDFRTLLLVPALAVGNVLFAQAPATPPGKAGAAEESATAARIERLVRELGSDSYRTRLQAEQDLRALGKAVIPALTKAAADANDGEVQWRARRLSRQIERGAAGAPVERSRGAADQAPEVDTDSMPRGERRPNRRRPDDKGRIDEELRSQFESLFERFERDFGVDVPRVRFFEDDFFRDLQNQMKAADGQSRGMSLQVGPDGVRVEVREPNDKGELENKVYEAPDLETFKRQYPDVLKQNGLGMGLDIGGLSWDVHRPFPALRGLVGPMRPGRRVDLDGRTLPRGAQQERSGLQEPDAPPVDVAPALPPVGRRLGITIRSEVPDALREYLELEAGVGLMVDEVQAASLAAALELQSGDIVVRIGETRIGSPADVQKALGAIDKGDPVTVHFVRKGLPKSATAAKTEGTQESETKSQIEHRRGKTDESIR